MLFWIHGGGFSNGAGSRTNYNGEKLARRGDVVVVTINYRLGALGFLNLNEITGGKIPSTGNEGLLDQVAALKWVHDNIAAFGGDPGNVTISGQSAGAMCVGSLLALPAARGLFHKAICQSGAASMVIPLKVAQAVAGLFLECLEVDRKDIQALRKVTTGQLLKVQPILQQKIIRAKLRTDIPFSLVNDGKVLAQMPLTAIAGGSAKSVSLLIGTTQDEHSLFGVTDPTLAKLDEAGLGKLLESMVSPEYVPDLVETYRKAREKRGEANSPSDILMAIQTDRNLWLPAVRLLETQGKQNNNIYSYFFTWKSPILGGKLGSCHAIDIGFVFGTYDKNFCGVGPAADALSMKTQDAWLAFVRTGNPSCVSLGEWPRYGKQRETMVLGAKTMVVKEPHTEELRVWETIEKSTP